MAILSSGLLLGCASRSGESSAEQAAVVREIRTTEVPVDAAVLGELDPENTFQLGIEREARADFPNLRRRRLTVFVNSASVDTRGRHTIEILNDNVMLSVAKVVLVEDEDTSRTATLERLLQGQRRYRVYRLTREMFRSTNDFVADSDAVVWDVPMSGATNSIEASVLGAALEKASLSGIRFIVLDRPSLIRTDFTDGPLSDLTRAGTLDAFLPLPTVPGATAAELARLYNEVYGIQADLTIQTMSHWSRADGNRWMQGGTWQLRPQDEARLAELRAWKPLQQGWSELRSLHRLVGDGLFSSRDVTVDSGNRAVLSLVPKQVPALAMKERLDAAKLAGLEYELSAALGAVEFRVAPDTQPALVELSLLIRRTASENPRQIPPDSDGLGYMNASLLQSLSRGLEPQQIRRRWSTAPDYLAFTRSREKVLLYQP